MINYPVPFRITTILLEHIGHVDVVTSQYAFGRKHFETCLFWGNDGESSVVEISYNRDVALKNHIRWNQANKIAKEIQRVRSQSVR